MSLSDCEKCWDTPCTCGWEYRNKTKLERAELAAAVLGIDGDDEAFKKLYELTPRKHPKAEEGT
jgi:hypothetical protein